MGEVSWYDYWGGYAVGIFAGAMWSFIDPWLGVALASLLGFGVAVTWLIRTPTQ